MMNYKGFLLAGLCGLLIISVVSGCGPRGPKRYTLSGAVTYKGKPVADGMIHFTPDSTQGNKGPQGYAIIKDGHYLCRGAEGVLPGPMFAELSGFAEANPGTEVDPRKPLFTGQITAFEMPAHEHTMDFELPLPPYNPQKPGKSSDPVRNP